MKKLYKRIVAIFMVLSFTVMAPFTNISAAEPSSEDTSEGTTEAVTDPSKPPEIASDAAIVMDAKTGQILYEKNAYTRNYPASITKILTALLAIEHGDLASTITMSYDAVWGIERGSSHIALDVDEQIKFEDALYAVLLVSANEAAWAIAEQVGGTLDNFCSMMNKEAKDLGCLDTNFVNANGLHDDNHYTTAYDMALITREALKYDKFREITSTTYYEIPPTNKNTTRYLNQDNRLILPASVYYYEDCLGGKTGFTDQAGGTLVTWAKRDETELICVVMHASSNADNYKDSIALYDYCFDNYYPVQPVTNYIFSNEQTKAAEDFLNEYYQGSNLGTMVLSVDANAEVLIKKTLTKDSLSFNLKLSGDNIDDSVIGYLEVTDGTDIYGKIPVSFSGYINSANTSATDATFSINDNTKKKHPLKVILIILLILGIIGGLVVLVYMRMQYVNKQRELYKKRRDEARRQGKRF